MEVMAEDEIKRALADVLVSLYFQQKSMCVN